MCFLLCEIMPAMGVEELERTASGQYHHYAENLELCDRRAWQPHGSGSVGKKSKMVDSCLLSELAQPSTADLPAGDGTWWKRRSTNVTKRPWGGKINPFFLTHDSRKGQETYVSFLTVPCPVGGQEHCVSCGAWRRAACSSS